MRAIMFLGAVLCLASCDSSKQQLANTQATLADVTKQRDDLNAKVASLQEQLNTTKTQLAAVKSPPPPPSGAVAAKTPDAKAAPSPANVKSGKPKHAHKS